MRMTSDVGKLGRLVARPTHTLVIGLVDESGVQ